MKTGLTRLAWSTAKLPEDCLQISRLQSQALDRELTRVETGLLKHHFERCETCRDRCEELRFVHRAARRYGVELIKKAVQAK